jgi:hypothetical protein
VLVVIVCSILGFHLKAFLLLLKGLGFELLGGEVEIAVNSFVQGAVRTHTVVFQRIAVPETYMTHATSSSGCFYRPEYVGKCGLKCNEEKASGRDQSSSRFWNPAEQPLVSDCAIFFQSAFNVLEK